MGSNFTAQRTMRTAQQLYEGIDVGEGAVGLITYMRTDSVNLAQEAIDEVRTFIVERFGKDSLPDEKRVYKTKSKNAQEAHEAIRPTSFSRVPAEIKSIATTLEKNSTRPFRRARTISGIKNDSRT